MAKQLVYTSVPQGLWPGTTGYCTVLSTEGIPRVLAEFLEKTSVYRITDRQQGTLIPATPDQYDRLVALNPSNLAHLQFQVRGKETNILAKTCLAGFDYSNRLRKLSHFLVLDEQDKTEAGPGWLVAQPNVFLGNWGAKPTMLTEDKSLPTGKQPPAPCLTWKAAAGDAGYAGQLANTILDRARPVYIVVDGAMDVLALLQEALALLPPPRRWEVTFATRYVSLPQGVQCQWRFVRKDTPEHEEALQAVNKLLIDLTCRLPPLPNSAEAAAARNGTFIESPLPSRGGFAPLTPPPSSFPVSAPLVEDSAGTIPTAFEEATPVLAAQTYEESFRPASGRLFIPPSSEPSAPPVAPPPGPPPPDRFRSSPPPLGARLEDVARGDDEVSVSTSSLSPKTLAATAAIGLGAVAVLLVAALAVFVLPRLKGKPPVAGEDLANISADAAELKRNLLENDGPDPASLRVTKIRAHNREYDVGTPIDLPLGRLSVQPDGTYIYVPGPKAKALGHQASAREEFWYVVQDNRRQPQEAQGHVLITLVGINDAPYVLPGKDQAVFFPEDFAEKIRQEILTSGEMPFAVELNLAEFVNDHDDKKVELTYTFVPPTGKTIWKTRLGASLKPAEQGKFIYHPNVAEMIQRTMGTFADDTLDFQVCDKSGEACKLRLIMHVPGLDFEPLARRLPLEWTVGEKEAQALGIQELLDNFVNPEENDRPPELVSIAGKPWETGLRSFETASKGKVTFDGKQPFRYTAPSGAGDSAGEDEFKYRVKNRVGTADGVVKIHFQRRPPVAPQKLAALLEELAHKMAIGGQTYEYGEGKKIGYLKLPMVDAPLDPGLAPHLGFEVPNVFSHAEHLTIEPVNGRYQWELKMWKDKNQSEAVAKLSIDEDVLKFGWEEKTSPDVQKKVQALAEASLLTLWAKPAEGPRLEEKFQFFPPIGIDAANPVELQAFEDSRYLLIPADRLTTNAAAIFQHAEQLKLQMIPVVIAAEPVKVLPAWKVNEKQLVVLLPICKLLPWQPEMPVQLTLSEDWKTAAHELRNSILESTKVTKPSAKEEAKLKEHLEAIRKSVRYPRKMHIVVVVDKHEFLLAYPK